MAVPIALYSACILAFLVLVLAVGFSFYMFRNYCLKKQKVKRRTKTDPNHPGIMDTANKTTTDDENTITTRPMKTHTFDQILKQEESSAYSVHSVKLPAPANGSGSAIATGVNTPLVPSVKTLENPQSVPTHELNLSIKTKSPVAQNKSSSISIKSKLFTSRMEQPSSNLYEGYKSVGHVTGPLPFIVRHGKSPQESRIITIVGKTFHTYTTNLSLTEVSIPHEEEIRHLLSDERYIYSASGRNVLQWSRGGRMLAHKLNANTKNSHKSDIKLMCKFGHAKLLSVDDDNLAILWNLEDRQILNRIDFDSGLFQITALCHPTGYKDKCLFGSKQGQLELWNVASEKCLYKYPGWDSKVTCLAQSPIENVVAIGLDDGHVYVHNLKYDEVVLKIYQEYGAITSISFRLDGQPYLVTGSPVGHLMVWNLERKRLASQIRNAHCDSISKCQFLRNKSLLVTSGNDNSVKIWSMDMSDGGGQLLHQRAGHSEPPSHIRFYGPKGFNLLSAGLDSTIKMFHLFSERLNRNLGTARMNSKSRHQGKGQNSAVNRLPAITCFAAETSKEKQWDNIAACHKNSSLVTTWNYDKCRMGEHIIMQPTFNKHDVYGSCICITGCGNFLIIGFSNGLIFKYNIQSGLFRQYYEHPDLSEHRAHDGVVTGVTVDGLDMVLVSASSDARLRLWNFKTAALMADMEMSAPICRIELHRENNLLAAALENNTIEVMDLETRALVRVFKTNSGRVLDMCLSPDSRWLIAALDDKSIRTWDLNLGKMIDAFRLAAPCTSLSISATGEFLATAHENSLGINIWCNFTLYCPTPLKPIDETVEPPLLDMPFVRNDDLAADDDLAEDKNNDDQVLPNDRATVAADATYVSPEQLDEQLITLSGLPSSRWKNLLNIEAMRKKLLIEEEEKRRDKQIKVPFFIPVKEGLKPQLDSETIQRDNLAQNGGDLASNTVVVSKINELRLLSPMAQCLIDCAKRGEDYGEFFRQLKELGPSATDAEIRSLGKDTCGHVEPMLCFLDAIETNLKSNIDYELTSAWLALFLKAHSDIIQTDSSIKERCASLRATVGANWDKLNEEFSQILCVLNFVRSSIL